MNKSKIYKQYNYFKRLIAISPKIAVQKAFTKPIYKIISKNQLLNDLKATTYSNASIDNIKLNYFSLYNFIKNLEINEDKIVKLANKFLKHNFNFLGTDWFNANIIAQKDNVNLNKFEHRINESNREEAKKILELIEQPYDFIDWSRDFKSGYSWDNSQWSKLIKYGDGLGNDIKIPWELGRLQHLPILAITELIIKERNQASFQDNYFKEFQNQTLDFIANNPPRFGVQWISSMDCSIRAVNLLVTYDLFRYSGHLLPLPIEKRFIQSIIDHGLHIYNNPEWSNGLRGNHYLTNLSGLIFISSYIYNEKTSVWLDYALKSLIRELDYQFNNDGSYFEASTAYHCLAFEIIIWTTKIIQELCNKLNLTKKQTKLINEYFKLLEIKLPYLINFTQNILDEKGELLQIGDNDSSRFIKLYPDLFD